jgi:hypothetical protein
VYEKEHFFNTVVSIVVSLKPLFVVDFKSTNTLGLIAVFKLEGNGIGVGQTQCSTSLTLSVQFAPLLCMASKG